MQSHKVSTRAVRVGQYIDTSDAHCEPIAFTSAYVFDSAADAAGKFSGVVKGNVYSRFTNPNVQAFEQRLASMEGAEDAVAFASGMAAIAGIGLAWLKNGDNVVCSRDVFGTTLHAFRHYFGRFNVEVRVVDVTDLDQWRTAIDSSTRFAFMESPSNPVQQVGNIAAIAELVHAAGSLLVVDNTLLTPVFQRPLRLGADLVVHSAGKYLDGQGRCVAGVVLGSQELMADLRNVMRTLGASLSPMNAWLVHKSLETLELRLRRIGDTASHLARWLKGRPGVGLVHYSGLTDHPQYGLACVQQSGFGGVLSFDVGVDQSDAWNFIDALQLISIATNIGDSRSMVTHPATTTHAKLSAEERHAAGIGDNLVRLSVGLEHVEDLLADIDQALKSLRRPARPPSAGRVRALAPSR